MNVFVFLMEFRRCRPMGTSWLGAVVGRMLVHEVVESPWSIVVYGGGRKVIRVRVFTSMFSGSMNFKVDGGGLGEW